MTTNEEWLRTQKFLETWIHRVFYDRRLNNRDKVTAVALSWYYHRKPTDARFRLAWPAQQTLADRTGQSADQVNRALSSLRKHGYVKRQGKTWLQGTVLYAFTLPDTDEDLTWLDSLATPDKDSAKDESPNTGKSPSSDAGETPNSDTGKSPSLNTGKTPNKSLDGYPLDVDSLTVPFSAPSELFIPPEGFLDIEYPHRDEFINHWIKVRPDAVTSYWYVLRAFCYGFSEEHRKDWVAAFKHFMSRVQDGPDFTGDPVDDGLDYFADSFADDRENRAEYTAKDFQHHWVGVTDGVSDHEFARAWEHLLAHHSGDTIVQAAASDLVHKKYPRELIPLLPPEII